MICCCCLGMLGKSSLRTSPVIAAVGSTMGRIFATSLIRTRRVRGGIPTASFLTGSRPDVTHRRAMASDVRVTRAASVRLIQASPGGYSSGPASSSTCRIRSSLLALCSSSCCSEGVVLIFYLLCLPNHPTHPRCPSPPPPHSPIHVTQNQY